MTNNTDNLANTLDDILGDIDDNEIGRACDTIIRVADQLHQHHVDQIMVAARVADPTLSGVGAEIRDTIRDNTDHRII